MDENETAIYPWSWLVMTFRSKSVFEACALPILYSPRCLRTVSHAACVASGWALYGSIWCMCKYNKCESVLLGGVMCVCVCARAILNVNVN